MGACTKAALAPHAAATAHRRPLTEPRYRHRPSPADTAAALTTRHRDAPRPAAPHASSARGRRQRQQHRPRQRHRCCPGPAAARRRCRSRRRGSLGPPPRAEVPNQLGGQPVQEPLDGQRLQRFGVHILGDPGGCRGRHFGCRTSTRTSRRARNDRYRVLRSSAGP